MPRKIDRLPEAGTREIADQLQHLQRTLRTVSKFSAAVARAEAETAMLDDACKVLVEDGEYELAWVGLTEPGPGRKFGLAARFPPATEPLYASSSLNWGEDNLLPFARALRSRKPVIGKAPDQRACLALPLMKDKRLLGVLEVHSERPDRVNREERTWLTRLAGDLAFGIDALRSRGERDEALHALRLNEQNLRTIIERDTDGILVLDRSAHILFANPAALSMLGRSAEQVVGQTFGFPLVIGELAEINLLRPDGSLATAEMRTVDTSWFNIPAYLVAMHDTTEQRRAQEQQRVLAKVFDGSRESILLTDQNARIVAVNRAFEDMMGYKGEEVVGKTLEFMAADRPNMICYEQLWEIVRSSGHWTGEIESRRQNGTLIPLWTAVSAVPGDHGVQQYVVISSDISEQKAAQAQIRFLAFHDALTGLPNRALFSSRLDMAVAQAKRAGDNVAVLFVDLDRFKDVNDSLGHAAGDELLRQAGERFRRCIRQEDTISRQGGDEFLLLLGGIKGPYAAINVARKIIRGFDKPFNIFSNEVNVTPSIGISLFPEDGDTGDILIRNADAAMYYAKEQGRNNFQFFVSELNRRAIKRISTENALRRSLERGEFELYYQPQVNADSGAVVGVEALLRWRHNGRIILPGEFIPIAEESGLIIPMGEWVVAEACRQHDEWRRQGLPSTRIAINLSASEFHQKRSFQRLRSMMKDASPDQWLEVELTEGVLMHEAEGSVRRLKSLRDIGISLAIDDFGTGYSSLSYLKRFPLDRLKVDRSFIHELPTNPSDRAITDAIIVLARNLNLSVVAEGVETEAEARLLRERHCEELQGFYFSRPLPAGEFVRWWKERLNPET